MQRIWVTGCRIVTALALAGAVSLALVAPSSAVDGPTTSTTTGVPGSGGTGQEQPADEGQPLAVTPPFSTITAGGGSCSINVGVAFDGSRLLVSCSDDSRIDAVNPADGTLLQTYNVPGLDSLGALAWDGKRNVLYACNDEADVVAIDLGGNSFTKLFTTADECYDGLAYDGSDDTFWTSGDVADTIYHYSYTGTELGTHNFGSELGGYGSSGIAVGGSLLYLANNGGSQIYTSDKAFSSVTLFAELSTRLEDMECDNLTFASQGTDVMWVIDAYDRTLNAFSIPSGSCAFGGGVVPEVIELEPNFTG